MWHMYIKPAHWIFLVHKYLEVVDEILIRRVHFKEGYV